VHGEHWGGPRLASDFAD